MDLRAFGRDYLGGRPMRSLRRLNARHPWSHNDFFHPWVLTELPKSRRHALDIGCGRGELLAVLAQHFDHVHGTDIDDTLRQEASVRCAGLPRVTISATHLGAVSPQFDLVTMIAVLHHLNVEEALADVSRMLSPGGRFLCVGLARLGSPVDLVWDVASTVSNPVIGYVHHPWVARDAPDAPSCPVKDPQLSVDELRLIVQRVLPGATMRRRLGFRHTIGWTKPTDQADALPG